MAITAEVLCPHHSLFFHKFGGAVYRELVDSDCSDGNKLLGAMK
jgi:hypothetical protein